ncbi:hypothetical protein ABES25_12775 [Bacillus gobiensis]|uniref:hypothetical protein n=1 Tax=Bacillus gobiensis TaxID=1441095 RepID=UPI003D19DE3B
MKNGFIYGIRVWIDDRSLVKWVGVDHWIVPTHLSSESSSEDPANEGNSKKRDPMDGMLEDPSRKKLIRFLIESEQIVGMCEKGDFLLKLVRENTRSNAERFPTLESVWGNITNNELNELYKVIRPVIDIMKAIDYYECDLIENIVEKEIHFEHQNNKLNVRLLTV